jgi:hypothetical protein
MTYIFGIIAVILAIASLLFVVFMIRDWEDMKTNTKKHKYTIMRLAIFVCLMLITGMLTFGSTPRCPTCGHRTLSTYCAECGTQLRHDKCRNCGESCYTPYCGKCGTKQEE